MLEKLFDFIKEIGLFKSFLAFFVFSGVVLFRPEWVVSIGMRATFIDENKDLIVCIFGISFLTVLFTVIHVAYKKYENHKNSDEQVALRYLTESLTQDQQDFLDEKFFKKECNKYQQFGKIEENDERGGELERHKIVEKGKKRDDDYGTYSYNLLSYSLKYLNKNIK